MPELWRARRFIPNREFYVSRLGVSPGLRRFNRGCRNRGYRPNGSLNRQALASPATSERTRLLTRFGSRHPAAYATRLAGLAACATQLTQQSSPVFATQVIDEEGQLPCGALGTTGTIVTECPLWNGLMRCRRVSDKNCSLNQVCDLLFKVLLNPKSNFNCELLRQYISGERPSLV